MPATRSKFALLPLLCALLFWATPGLAQDASPEDVEGYIWDLTDLYPDPAAWQTEFAAQQARVESLRDHQGTLGESADSLLRALREIADTSKEVMRLYIYASLKRDEDQRVA